MGNGYAGQVAGPAEGVPRQAMDVHHAAVVVVVARDVAIGRGGGLGTQRVLVGVWNGSDNNDGDDDDHNDNGDNDNYCMEFNCAIISEHFHIWSAAELHAVISQYDDADDADDDDDNVSVHVYSAVELYDAQSTSTVI